MKTKKKTTRGKWIELGQIGVDSGQLMICDPCYSPDANEYIKKERETGNFIQKNIKMQPTIDLAVIFTTGYGDGVYRVTGYEKDGRILGVYIHMDLAE